MKDFNEYPTIALDDDASCVVMIDQTLLPGRLELLRLSELSDIWEAIKLLRVRGAPAIGVTAGFAAYLAAKSQTTEDIFAFEKQFDADIDFLASSRPTAVNLFWALGRMKAAERDASKAGKNVAEIKQILLAEANAICSEDIRICKSIGEHALSLLRPGQGLLTHCNAGRLATVEYGTATAAMYLGHERGYDFDVYCDETRPLLQGARLTAFELAAAGMHPTVLCDNMSASLMKTGRIHAVFTGCDRVAANGDSANKIGTSLLALAAKRYGVPFYICAPSSTLDMQTPNGEGIVIEQRAPEEVTEMWYSERMAPEGIGVYNPAFDVTDADLITAIITEDGAIAPGDLKARYPVNVL
ncbi:MAG: S-methyl-5-thioribose-1-phosphate isomerase [Clostridiales Family XIII bacterium]|jgi:methylthioribose-1-phosphate isomerase|nr:S-methyl-5-thioribose-1-phosphate isomerase [Clostridiales Family XIII bacterium]